MRAPNRIASLPLGATTGAAASGLHVDTAVLKVRGSPRGTTDYAQGIHIKPHFSAAYCSVVSSEVEELVASVPGPRD